jgi:hypothetical protein
MRKNYRASFIKSKKEQKIRDDNFFRWFVMWLDRAKKNPESFFFALKSF